MTTKVLGVSTENRQPEPASGQYCRYSARTYCLNIRELLAVTCRSLVKAEGPCRYEGAIS